MPGEQSTRHNLPERPTPAEIAGQERAFREIHEMLGPDTLFWVVPITHGYGDRRDRPNEEYSLELQNARRSRKAVALEAAWRELAPEGNNYDVILWVDFPGFSRRDVVTLRGEDEYGSPIHDRHLLTVEEAAYKQAVTLLPEEERAGMSVDTFWHMPIKAQRQKLKEVLQQLGERVLLVYDNPESDLTPQDEEFLVHYAPKGLKKIITGMYYINLPWPVQLPPQVK